MESNIYDLVISELILKDSTGGSGGSISGANSPKLTITSTSAKNEIVVNTNTSITFTSTVTNIPTGYSIKSNTHSLTFDGGNNGTSINTADTLTVTKVVRLDDINSVYVVDGSITLQKSGESDIVLTTSLTITGALPIFYGVKTYSATPTYSQLSAISSTTREFTLASSNLGRIYIVMPATLSLVTLVDPSGLIIPVSDFEVNVSGQLYNGINYKYYMLKWDTQLTGTNNKLFKLNII